MLYQSYKLINMDFNLYPKAGFLCGSAIKMTGFLTRFTENDDNNNNIQANYDRYVSECVAWLKWLASLCLCFAYKQ